MNKRNDESIRLSKVGEISSDSAGRMCRCTNEPLNQCTNEPMYKRTNVRRSAVSGQALVITIFIVFFALILIPIGANLIFNSLQETKLYMKNVAQARNVARAGLVDTISWFKRQPSQPVHTNTNYPDLAFNPKYNVDSSLSDTMDPNIGLVKEYELDRDRGIWGRYEVKRQTSTAVSPWDPYAVHDITGERIHVPGFKNGDGIVWYLCSTGYVFYKRSSFSVFSSSSPDTIAKSRMSTEIRRLSMNQPYAAAFIVNDGGNVGAGLHTVNLYDNGEIRNSSAGGSAAAHLKGNTAQENGTGWLNCTQKNAVATSSPTVQYIFGVTLPELKTLADNYVQSVANLPVTMPSMALTYIDLGGAGTATFDNARPLGGGGILVVDGNLVLTNNANGSFAGLVYVTGTISMYSTNRIDGQVVGYNGLTLSQAGAFTKTTITYDTGALDTARMKICQYRENKASLNEYSGFK